MTARSLAGVFFVADFAGVIPAPGCGGADVVLVARTANPCRLISNPTALVLVAGVAAAATVVEDPLWAPLLFVFPLGVMPSMAFRADAGVAVGRYDAEGAKGIRPMSGRRRGSREDDSGVRGSSRPSLDSICCCCWSCCCCSCLWMGIPRALLADAEGLPGLIAADAARAKPADLGGDWR